MKKILSVMSVLFAFGFPAAQGLATTIDFEGVTSDSGAAWFQSALYAEDGMQVSSATRYGILGKDHALPGYPAGNFNGSARFTWCTHVFLACSNRDLITISNELGQSFDLVSLDASNINIGQQNSGLLVTGFSALGGSVTTTLDLQLDTWNTYAFDSAWTGLQSVTISVTANEWSPGLDNIEVRVVPLPAAAWLFGASLGLLGLARRRKPILN